MKNPSTPPTGTKRRLLLGILYPVICVFVAFGTARFIRKHDQDLQMNQSTSPPTPVLTPDTILNGLPQPDLNTPTGKTLAAAILKTRETPNRAENWVQTGEALAQLQRDSENSRFYDSAEAVYQEALRLRPDSVGALAGMAWVTGGRHRFDQSIAWANQALKHDPDHTAAYGILGDAALELGDYDAAFEHYQKMMDLRPDLSSLSRGAHLLWVTGDKSKAMWLMGKAINAGAPFAENTAWCRTRMATMLFHDGALLPAEKAIQPSLDAGLKNPHLLLIAARIAAAKADFPAAEKYYRTILEAGPDQQALAGLGDLAAVQGNPVEAEKFYQHVESIHAGHLENGTHDHGFMAKFLADHDRNLVQALRMVEEHKLTRNVQEADTLAWVYYKNGKMPQAIAAMKKALSQKTPDAEIHYHAGMIASAHGDLTSAKKHLEEALTMNPNFSIIQAPLALKALQQIDGRKSLGSTDAPERRETP